MNRDVPVLFSKKDECFGCSACYAICPVNAIEMTPDAEGFLYPQIREDECIGCKQCMTICPMKILMSQHTQRRQ